MNERENEVLREMMLHEDIEKARRIQELSGQELDLNNRYFKLRENLDKAKSELQMLDEQYRNSHQLQKLKIMEMINKLTFEVRGVEAKRIQMLLPEQPTREDKEEND